MVEDTEPVLDDTEGEACVYQIKRLRRQCAGEGVGFDVIDVGQTDTFGPPARMIELGIIEISADNRPVAANPFTQSIGNATGAAAQIKHAPATAVADTG